MDIIDRIKKLLRLAEHAGSEQEAALAAERAAQLMAQHEIHEAQLSDSDVEVRDPMVECHEVTTTRKRVAWHTSLATAVAESYGAHAYTVGGRIAFFGRLSAVQAAGYTTLYLIREIEEMCDKDAPTHLYSRGFRNAYRLGYARRIAERIREAAARELKRQRRQVERAQAAQATKRAERESFDVSDVAQEPAAADAAPIPTPPPEAAVLARVEKKREEVRQAYDEYKKDWGRARPIGQISSGGGYRAGKAAGDRAKLPKRGAHGRLPKGQDVLK